MVYNFSLPPLTLHAIHTGKATTLSRWAAGLFLPSGSATFFNFLASHDGIGVTPARDLLSEDEVQDLAIRVEELGGAVSYKTNSDGSRSAYELNVNYLDALGQPGERQDRQLQARRFLVAQAIMLSLRGVPGIYFHSLVGSRNWKEGVRDTGRARTINRQKLGRARLERELDEPGSLRHLVFDGYRRLLEVRAANSAFHPNGGQQVIDSDPAVFTLLRTSPNGRNRVLCLHNVSGQSLGLDIDANQLSSARSSAVTELIGGRRYSIDRDNRLTLRIKPYEVLWLSVSRKTDN